MISISYTLHCDGDSDIRPCNAQTNQNFSEDGCHTEAWKRGWANVGGEKWYCPECYAMMSRTVPQT